MENKVVRERLAALRDATLPLSSYSNPSAAYISAGTEALQWLHQEIKDSNINNSAESPAVWGLYHHSVHEDRFERLGVWGRGL